MAVWGFAATEIKRILKLGEGKVRESWKAAEVDGWGGLSAVPWAGKGDHRQILVPGK